jgi:hypothetical protein
MTGIERGVPVKPAMTGKMNEGEPDCATTTMNPQVGLIMDARSFHQATGVGPQLRIDLYMNSFVCPRLSKSPRSYALPPPAGTLRFPGS